VSKGFEYKPHGIGFWNVSAMLLSYFTHGFSGWTIVHGFFGIFYVVYWACGGGQ
jgi:hypothetical protein